jgi:hypothetical protein
VVSVARFLAARQVSRASRSTPLSKQARNFRDKERN